MEGYLLHVRRILSPRSFLFSFLFLFIVIPVQAKTVIIGAGSGYITISGMTGLNPGDTVSVAPGQYSGAAFNNLTGITITGNAEVVLFYGTGYT